MVTTTHRIHKQQWLISVATANEAFPFRKQLRDRLEDTLEPVFNRAFDEVSDIDKIIRIPRLELKVKVKNDAELWENLPQALYEQLTVQLQKIVNKDFDSQISETLKVNPIVSEHLHRFEILIHYLNLGFFPWQVPHLSVSESLEELEATIQDQFDQLIEYLYNNKLGEAVFFRLFQLVSPGRILEFIERLLINGRFSKHDDRKSFFRGLFESDGSSMGQHSRLSIAATLVSISLHNGGRPTITGLISEAVNVLPADKVIDLQKFIATLPEFSKLFPVERLTSFNNLVQEGDKKELFDWEENGKVQSNVQAKVNQETDLLKENFKAEPSELVHSEHLPSEHVPFEQILSGEPLSALLISEQVHQQSINQNDNDLPANYLQGHEFSNTDISEFIMFYQIKTNKTQKIYLF